jgi:hypothetical protein
MPRLDLFIASVIIAASGLAASGQARALPQPEAEQAYANGDYKTAFALWLPLAVEGSARAQMNIARMYERGEYVAQDSAMAADWYRKAAEQSMRDADNGSAPTTTAGNNAPTSSQAVVEPPTVVAGPVAGPITPASPAIAPTYVQPVTQPVYYPVIIPRPLPLGFAFHHHGRR